MNIKINENYLKLSENYLFSDIAKKVKQYQIEHPDAKIIRLGIGDVSLPLPKIVASAMAEAAKNMGTKEGFMGYPPEYGHTFLKNAISDYYSRNNIQVDSNDIFVSDGAKSDLGNIVDILGDNDIYIPNPVYPVYVDSNIMSGRRIHFIDGNMENDFLPVPDGLEMNGGIIYLCSPNNPTGALYSRNQLEKWVNFALSTGSLIIFDSAYEAFINGDFPHSIYEIEGANKCAIEINSLSKVAGFTGTRCGWTVVPSTLMAGDVSIHKLWSRRQATKFNGVSYPVQKAAEAALSVEGIKECKKNIEYYMENARALAKLFTKKGIYFTGGINSPYIWLKCPKNMTSWEFFDYLLKEVNIVGTPGCGFGSNGEGFFRLTAFGTHEDTFEAIERLEKLL